MTDFAAYNATTHPIIRKEDDYNSILDHAFEKSASYILRKNGSYYEIINGSTGKISYGGSGNVGGATGTVFADVIQACINANYSEGIMLFLKPETYYVTKTIFLRGRILMQGAGMGATELYLNNDVNDNMFEWDTANDTEYFTQIQDMELDGNNANNATNGKALCIPTAAGKRLSDLHIFRLYVHHFREVAVEVDYGWGVMLDNNIIEFNTGMGGDLAGNSMRITNNRFLENYYGAQISGGNNIISNNMFYRSDRHGLVILGAAYGNTITGNQILENSQEHANWYDGLWLSNSNNTTVVGNAFDGGSQERYGLKLDATAVKCVVIGNGFKNGSYGTDYYLDNGTNTVIDHNAT